MVAIKKIILKGTTSAMVRMTLRELKILRLLQHENLLTLYSILKPKDRENFDEIYLVTNLMMTNLTQEIQKTRRQKRNRKMTKSKPAIPVLSQTRGLP